MGGPAIVGIVNVTEDSFSDGGRYLTPDAAIDHARRLAAEGADWIELGPASSHPDACIVPAREQIARLRPVMEALAGSGWPISVDATDPEVLRYAIEAGAAILNDVRGFPDPALRETLADASVSLVVVHSLLERERAERNDATPAEVLASIDRFFARRIGELTAAGVAEERIVLDPGMGFFLGRDPRSSIAVLQRIGELKARFGRPVLVSVSRKSFLRTITGRGLDTIGAATLAAELFAARRGADYLRTHEVGALHDALRVEASLSGSSVERDERGVSAERD
jgi:dihydropteroate synthase